MGGDARNGARARGHRGTASRRGCAIDVNRRIARLLPLALLLLARWRQLRSRTQ